MVMGYSKAMYPVACLFGKHIRANNLAMMVTTSILQMVLFVSIGTKFVHDIATIITDQLCSCRPYS